MTRWPDDSVLSEEADSAGEDAALASAEVTVVRRVDDVVDDDGI